MNHDQLKSSYANLARVSILQFTKGYRPLDGYVMNDSMQGSVLVTTNVRYIYHGEYLNMGMVTYAEMYTYTVAWLLLGMVLLFIDFIKQDKMLRIASLSIILLTVGKVFVCDISELTGLYRVFSFFGLRSSLIGLSYFYTRFILGRLRMN